MVSEVNEDATIAELSLCSLLFEYMKARDNLVLRGLDFSMSSVQLGAVIENFEHEHQFAYLSFFCRISRACVSNFKLICSKPYRAAGAEISGFEST